jgi:tRNA modification GTPase
MHVREQQASITVAALLTPPGRGAVATIAVRGDLTLFDESPALFLAASGRVVSSQLLNRVSFGHWGHDVPEDVVVCRISADEVEIHCHGGSAAVRRVLNDLAQRGCRIISWQDFAAAGRDRIDVECTVALTQATTLRTARILLGQRTGLLRSAIAELRQLPLDEVVARTTEMLSWSEFGRHLTEPWQVVLCGLPNVGKSSLINALLGYSRSIVFDEPGTTRDVVTGQTAFDGWPVELSDTAGLREGADELESEGVSRARRRADEADLIVLVFDQSRPVHADETELLRRWPQSLRAANKRDLQDAWQVADVGGAIAVSAVTQEGLADLMRAIVSRLVPHVPPAGTPIPIMPRQVAVIERIRASASAGNVDATRRSVEECLDGQPG